MIRIDCEGCFAPCCIAMGCGKLKDGKCTIYATRPLICNVNEYYKKYYAGKMSQKEFLLRNIENCKFLQKNFTKK